MAIIQAPSRIDPRFGDGFNQFLRILERVNNIKLADEELLIDMSGCNFLTPFFLLPLAVLIEREKKKRPVTIIKDIKSKYCKEYLDFISFEGGLRPEDIIGQTYKEKLTPYENLNYIPIVNFPANRTDQGITIRDTFMSVLGSVVTQRLNLQVNYKTAVMYLVDEAVNNIIDHSAEERGYIFAQYYPSKQFMDICVVDNGVGIYQTYKDNGIDTVTSHKVALEYAGTGKSTKNRPAAEGRGYGITSSKAMVADGLDGKYLLISGNAFLFKALGNEMITQIPVGFTWGGTVLGLRIPYSGNVKFNPSDFYEI